MPTASTSTVTISVAPPGRRAAVVRLLMPADTTSGNTASTDLTWAGLFEARRGDATVGAVWGRIRPGRTAEVIPPQLVDDENNATADGLLTRLDQLFRAERVRVAYAYLAAHDQQTPQWLIRHGYRYVTEVLLLARPLDHFPSPAAQVVLTYAPCRPSEHSRWCELLAATEEDSLDFPTLNRVLASEDLVAGYEATGDCGSRLWRIARHQQRDVGCLLLADHAQRRQVELLYLGLLPSARGRGWGRELVRVALQLAQELRREQVVLAVDANNDPAIATYSAESFVVCDRKRVWLRTF